MASQFRKFIEGIRVVPKSTDLASQTGDLEVDSLTGKLEYFQLLDKSPVVTEAHQATLSNKTIDSDDNNTISVELSSLKTVLSDADKIIRRDAAGAVVSGNEILDSSQIVTLDATQSFTNKTFDAEGTGNSLTNIKDSNIKVGADIDRAKLAPAAVVSSVVVNDATGVMSTLALTSAQIILGDAAGVPTATSVSGEVTIDPTGVTTVGTMANVATSGFLSTQVESVAVASTITVSKSFVRLTSGAATIDGIAAGLDGQHLVISNLTGANVTIANQSLVESTPENRVITGTGEDVLLEPNASLFLIYDATLSNSKWMVVGGSGGGAESTITTLAGEDVLAGDAVYLDTTGEAYKIDAGDDSSIEFIGVILDAALTGEETRVQTSGEVTIAGATFSVGSPVYIDPLTPGAYTQSVPSDAGQWVIQAGIATAANKMVINGAGSATAVKITSEVDAYVYANVASVSASQTLTNGNSIVLATGGVGGITLTLPSPTAGKIFNIKKVDAAVGTITINTSSGTIDGVASKVITSQYDSLTITSDGNDFFII